LGIWKGAIWRKNFSELILNLNIARTSVTKKSSAKARTTKKTVKKTHAIVKRSPVAAASPAKKSASKKTTKKAAPKRARKAVAGKGKAKKAVKKTTKRSTKK
jgi:hypothetical protein